ncbi:transposase [Candidatus Microthrix parvicella RN1]|jgi:transposase|uniref:Transposase n=1 Tax=Candidatus Neomicrothrix parvicella RN1 TaxID=1229780 RepID=R4Z5G4_9ACTN|nr:transposase [Candidatus Microthrix parvicella RN1]
MNDTGEKLAAKRFPEGLEGIAGLHALIAEHTTDPGEVIVGIETERGMWVQALIAGGYRVYAINPLSVSRYRDRHNVAGAKSDPGDAKLLADLVRTDRHNHRPVAGDSDEAAGLKVLARSHQNLIWDRTRHTNRLRNDLREFFPAALVAFESLADRDAVAVLGKAPHPELARRLSVAQIRSALRKGGRQRNLDDRATQIQAALRTPQLTAPPDVAAAFAATTKALVEVIAGLNDAIGELETELATHFDEHPDADIYLSLPGLGVVLGARVLAEFGDDPDRYDTAKSRRNYAGTSPLTIASGKKHAVLARHVRNRRLYDAIDQWAFCAITTSPGCRQFYDHRRTTGDLHHQALRALGNRLVGYLHGCLRTRSTYNEHTAWAHRQPAPTQTAA